MRERERDESEQPDTVILAQAAIATELQEAAGAAERVLPQGQRSPRLVKPAVPTTTPESILGEEATEDTAQFRHDRKPDTSRNWLFGKEGNFLGVLRRLVDEITEPSAFTDASGKPFRRFRTPKGETHTFNPDAPALALVGQFSRNPSWKPTYDEIKLREWEALNYLTHAGYIFPADKLTDDIWRLGLG